MMAIALCIFRFISVSFLLRSSSVESFSINCLNDLFAGSVQAPVLVSLQTNSYRVLCHEFFLLIFTPFSGSLSGNSPVITPVIATHSSVPATFHFFTSAYLYYYCKNRIASLFSIFFKKLPYPRVSAFLFGL